MGLGVGNTKIENKKYMKSALRQVVHHLTLSDGRLCIHTSLATDSNVSESKVIGTYSLSHYRIAVFKGLPSASSSDFRPMRDPCCLSNYEKG